MTALQTDRLIGLLFLLAMVVSVVGNLLLLPVVSAPELADAIATGAGRIRAFALLMVVNSLAVVGIGACCAVRLSSMSRLTAAIYLPARLVEAVVLLLGVICILSLAGTADTGEVQAPAAAGAEHLVLLNWYAYHIAMVFLGLGSLPFCLLLFRNRLVPAVLALLGLAGYGILAASSMAALADISLGLASTLPVLVFEVTLGAYLLFSGFGTARPVVA
jgi:hypothetical protein